MTTADMIKKASRAGIKENSRVMSSSCKDGTPLFESEAFSKIISSGKRGNSGAGRSGKNREAVQTLKNLPGRMMHHTDIFCFWQILFLR
jgi:hypothetical protein